MDQAALVRALEEGWIAGAALDVYLEEPLSRASKAALRRLPNLVLTPHTAWYSDEALRELQEKVAWTLRAALEARVPGTVVNPEVLSFAGS